MKTTLEIPDDLMRRIKLRAVHRNQKLKDAVTQLLEIGMSATSNADRARSMPKPVRLKGPELVDISSIEGAINAGRD